MQWSRQAASQASLCTLAVGALTTGTGQFVHTATGGGLDLVRIGAAAGCLALGWWLLYLGHCRNLMAPK